MTVVYCGLSLVLALAALVINSSVTMPAGELHLPTAFTILAAANLVMLEIWRILHGSKT